VVIFPFKLINQGKRMPTNGFIDGNAPPFILLSLVLAGFVYSTSLYHAPTFGRLRRNILYLVLFVQFLLITEGGLIIYRIMQNNGSQALFWNLDRIIISGIAVLLSLMLIIGILLMVNARRYPVRPGGL